VLEAAFVSFVIISGDKVDICMRSADFAVICLLQSSCDSRSSLSDNSSCSSS
jgi:hypothetical protein